MTPKHHYAFKRLETDRELQLRVHELDRKSGIVYGYGVATDPRAVYGQALDDLAWARHQMQRRIVDDVA